MRATPIVSLIAAILGVSTLCGYYFWAALSEPQAGSATPSVGVPHERRSSPSVKFVEPASEISIEELQRSRVSGAVIVSDTAASSAPKLSTERPHELDAVVQSLEEYEAMTIEQLQHEKGTLVSLLASLEHPECWARIANGLAEYKGPPGTQVDQSSLDSSLINAVMSDGTGTYLVVLPPNEYPELYQLKEAATHVHQLVEKKLKSASTPH